jgi:hypothetical protein
MGYTESAWTAAKSRYTQLAHKKKPGAKFLGIFTKSSGLEPLFKTFDKLPSSDFPNRRKNIDGIRAKAHAYLAILDKAAIDDASSNKDATVKQNLASANKTLRADVEALLAEVEAEYAKDLETFKSQLGKGKEAEAEANKRKKNEGRGMVNFGDDPVVPQELVAAVKKAEAALAAFSSNPTPDNFNTVAAGSIINLHSFLGKFGKAVDSEYKAIGPFAKRIPTTYNKAQMDNHIDQISITIKRTKTKLKI